MFINVKILKGSDCTLEVSTNSTIIYVKELVAKNMQIPVNQQKLVFKGKTLSDEMCLEDYDIIDGAKLHLLVSDNAIQPKIASKSDCAKFWEHLSKFLMKYYTKDDVNKIIVEFKKNLNSDIEDLSLDDIERLAKVKLSQRESDSQ